MGRDAAAMQCCCDEAVLRQCCSWQSAVAMLLRCGGSVVVRWTAIMRRCCGDAAWQCNGAAAMRRCGGSATVRTAEMLRRCCAAVRLCCCAVSVSWPRCCGSDATAVMLLSCGGGTGKHRPVREEDRQALISQQWPIIVDVVISQFVDACTHPKILDLLDCSISNHILPAYFDTSVRSICKIKFNQAIP